jgi:hypothetical protein
MPTLTIRRSGRGEEGGEVFAVLKRRCPPRGLFRLKAPPVLGHYLADKGDALKVIAPFYLLGRFYQPTSIGSRFDRGSCSGALRLHPARDCLRRRPGRRLADMVDSMSAVAGMSVPE